MDLQPDNEFDPDLFEAQLDALRASVHKFRERDGHPAGDRRSRARAAVADTTAGIRAHPLVAVAIALGVGYLVMRIVRRGA